MKKRPRIYYASGMISLLLIPLLGYYLINKRLNPNSNQRCIEIVLCSKDTACNLCFKCVPPKRIYKQINFSKTSLMERKTLFTIDSIANILFMNGDTIHGLEINFNKYSTYKTLIRILDICKRRHIPIYMLNGYQFWICFDYDYLKIGDSSFKTKLIGRNKHLLETENNDYEIQITPMPGLLSNDIVIIDNSAPDYEAEERNKNFLDFVYQRKLLIGLLAFVYILMIVFTIKGLKRF